MHRPLASDYFDVRDRRRLATGSDGRRQQTEDTGSQVSSERRRDIQDRPRAVETGWENAGAEHLFEPVSVTATTSRASGAHGRRTRYAAVVGGRREIGTRNNCDARPMMLVIGTPQ